jgi:hypothetical protein
MYQFSRHPDSPVDAAPRWWPPAPEGHPVWALEMGFGARVHQPFTHAQYMTAVGIAVNQGRTAANRLNDSTLALLYVLGEIDRVKTAGGAVGPHDPLFNHGRNSVIW